MDLKDILNVMIYVFIIWIGCLLSIIIHEMGHAIGYMLSSREEKGSWHIVAGRGKQILKTKRMRICAFPFTGYFEITKGMVSRRTALLMAAGGPVASLLMTTFLFVLLGSTFRTVLSSYEHIDSAARFVAFYNLWQFITSILPLRYPA